VRMESMCFMYDYIVTEQKQRVGGCLTNGMHDGVLCFRQEIRDLSKEN
jgi:hypothetical protein